MRDLNKQLENHHVGTSTPKKIKVPNEVSDTGSTISPLIKKKVGRIEKKRMEKVCRRLYDNKNV